ncbi:MAG: GDSL-type esterase/lipase family protein [Bryobacterales bacterium]
MSRLFELRLGRLIGVVLILASVAAYRSENASVLGLWSKSTAAGLVGLAGLALLFCVASWRRRGRPSDGAGPGTLFDAACLLVGVAYAWSAVDDPRQMLRLNDLNLFGSYAPIPAGLEWLAMALVLAAGAVWAIRLKGPWMGPAVAMLSVAAGLLLGEGIARAWTLSAPAPRGWGLFSTDAWRRSYAHLNSLGFRDAEHAVERSGKARRLLVVGDSFAFGWGVSDPRERFGEQLASLLADRTGEPWESLNASNPGAHTLRHIEYLEQMTPYHPDAVVLLYVFNDIDYLEDRLPKATREKLFQPGRLHPVSILFHNSYLFQEAYIRWRSLSYSGDPNTPVASFGNLGEGYPYSHDDLLDEHMRDLAHFVEVAEEAGAVAAIVPMDLDVSLGGPHMARYRRFVQRAREHGLPVWDLSAALADTHRQEFVLNRFDAHPNAQAYRLAARSVIDRLAGKWRRAMSAKSVQASAL